MTARAPGRTVVLGATGCVGRRLCAGAAAAGHDVVAVARHPGTAVAPLRVRPVDLLSVAPGELAALLTEVDASVVLNATTTWSDSEQAMAEGNVALARRLLDALARMDRPPRLVHVGTVHEYGPLEHGSSLTEQHAAAPTTAYARSKLAASDAVIRAARAGEADAVVVRLANTFGPHPASRDFLGNLAGRLRALPPGDALDVVLADSWRDYVDVRDAVDAVLRAALRRGADPVVNVGRGEALAVRDLVRRLVVLGGLPPSALRETAGSAPSRVAGGSWTRVDIGHAARTLAWHPRRGVDESLRAMWETAEAA